MEGTRPVLVEIQALVAPCAGMPRRAVVGWDSARLSMVLAVLEAHCGVRFAQHDVYLNVAGGYRISEPAADLAVAAALVSSLTGLALPADCVYFGEISLSGAIRAVAHAPQRLKEAEKLGFGAAVMPAGSDDMATAAGSRSFQPEMLADSSYASPVRGAAAMTDRGRNSTGGRMEPRRSTGPMPITLLDGILIGFTLVSAMLAMVRVFARSPVDRILGRRGRGGLLPASNRAALCDALWDNAQPALAIAAAAVFFVALIVITVITMKIADFIIDSRVGALDRTLGFLYGAARGVLVVAVGLMFFNWLVGSNPPAWITEAKSRPLLEEIGARLQALLPDDPENSIFDRLNPPNADGEPADGQQDNQ